MKRLELFILALNIVMSGVAPERAESAFCGWRGEYLWRFFGA